MPFNSSGAYVLPVGTDGQVAGNVIRSATWNAAFDDIQAALTSLTYSPQNPTTNHNTSGSFSISVTDTVVLVNAPAPTITMPLSSTKAMPVKIFGNATMFGTNKSVLVFSGSDTALGFGTISLTQNYQLLTLYPLASGGYYVGS